MKPVIEVRGLKKSFSMRGTKGKVRAVDGLTFSIGRQEAFGLAGESGCGKTTTADLLMGLTEPTEGDIRFLGNTITGLNRAETKQLRRNIQMIFQDPYGSLNPRKTVGSILSLPFQVHEPAPKDEIKARVLALLDSVELKPAESYWNRHPHELSGGQRQRLAIARSIALHPKLVISDEAVAALDMSTRADILNLMRQVKEQSGASFLMISHDLSVLRNMCDRIAIMYLGKFVEVADKEELFANPQHPYTKALLSATLIPDPRVEQARERIVLHDDPGSAMNLPKGCSFHPRCPFAEARCRASVPELVDFGPNHQVSCHLVGHDGSPVGTGTDPAKPAPQDGADHVNP
jgi:oligopeptide transport system ATP-binding protein